MLNFVISICAGWPAVVVSLILATAGLLRRDHRFLVGAALLSLPFSLAVSGFPAVTFPALCNTFLPLFLFASGFLISRDREMLAWLLAIPFYLAVILLWFAAMAGNA